MAFIPFKFSKIASAIETGDTKKVVELLDKGVDPNISNMDEETPLYLAIKYSRPEIASVLIDRGAKDRNNYYGPYLHHAIYKGNIDTIQALLEKAPDMLQAKDRKGNTPLHEASKWGRADIIALLISKGLDPNAKNNAGRTALFLAAENGHREAEEVLQPVTKKATAILASFEPRRTEEWKMLSAHKIARITNEQEIGYRITDLFNFAARDRIRIVQNLETKAESAETTGFDDIGDKDALQEALRQLNARGGKADPDSVAGLQKNRLPPAPKNGG